MIFKEDSRNSTPRIDQGQYFVHYILICDMCESERIIFDAFDKALEYLELNDWKTFQDNEGDWITICPKCKDAKREIV